MSGNPNDLLSTETGTPTEATAATSQAAEILREKERRNRRTMLWTMLFALVFLGPSMFGFVTKFIEFMRTFGTAEEGVFAIPPMINYMLASLGFLCMLTWAMRNGMFTDIEEPKETMLTRELALDEREGYQAELFKPRKTRVRGPTPTPTQ